MRECNLVWKNLGQLLHDQILDHKGVEITKFATFSLTNAMEPALMLSPQFCQQYRVQQKRVPAFKSGISVQRINFAQLAFKSSVTREVAQQAVSEIISSVGTAIRKRGKVCLSFNPLVEININSGQVSIAFSSSVRGILRSSTGVNTAAAVAANRQGGKTARLSPERSRGRAVKSSQYGQHLGGFGRKMEKSQRRNNNENVDRYNPQDSFVGADDLVDGGDFDNQAWNQPAGDDDEFDDQEYDEEPVRGRGGRNGRGAPPARSAQVRSRGARRGSEQVAGELRTKVVRRGGEYGIHRFGRLLRVVTDTGKGTWITRKELHHGARDFGMKLEKTDLDDIVSAFGKKGERAVTGAQTLDKVNVGRLLDALRGELIQERAQLVTDAYRALNAASDGEVTLADLKYLYNPASHPDVRSGKVPKEEAVEAFLAQWDCSETDRSRGKGGRRGQPGEGKISERVFQDFYKSVSAAVKSDEAFEDMVSGAWGLDEAQAPEPEEISRRKVKMTHFDGSTTMDELDVGKGGNAMGASSTLRSSSRQQQRGRRQQANSKHSVRRDVYGRRADSGSVYGKPSNAGAVPQCKPSNIDPTDDQELQKRRIRRRRAWVDRGLAVGDLDQKLQRRGQQGRSLRETGYYDEYDDEGYGSGGGAEDVELEPLAVLRELVYTPPVNLEMLCQNLCTNRTTSDKNQLSLHAFALTLVDVEAKLLCGIFTSPDPLRCEAMPLARFCDFESCGYVDVKALHDALVRKYGQGSKNGRLAEGGADKPWSPLERIQGRVAAKHGPVGIHLLARKFRSLDPSGTQVLSRDELKYGFTSLGIHMSMRDVEDLLVYFDEDRSGGMTIDELLKGLRGKISRKRRAMVKRVFEHLDVSGDGQLSLEEMRLVVDVSRHPDVLTGKLTENEAIRKFMSQWDAPGGDGIITFAEFLDYYHSVSAAIDGEEFFAQMLRDSWSMDGLELHKTAIGAGGCKGVGETHEADDNYRSRSSSSRWAGVVKQKPSRHSRRPNRDELEEPDSPRSCNSEELDDRRINRREERGDAVMQLQKVYRAHRSRDQVTYEQRKERKVKMDREEDSAHSSAKPKRFIRPALRSTYGF
jgi:Ca2+-binding EF-hand superfamily protein/nucleoid DNA-binding protein